MQQYNVTLSAFSVDDVNDSLSVVFCAVVFKFRIVLFDSGDCSFNELIWYCNNARAPKESAVSPLNIMSNSFSVINFICIRVLNLFSFSVL